MNFKELMVAATAAAVMLVATPHLAWADGPVSAYDGTEDLALAPNERVVSEGLTNDDGAVEDPQHPMTPTARAFRNGLINGRAMQKQMDAQNVPPLPPLPADMPTQAPAQPKAYAGYPQAAQVQAIPAQRPMYAPVQQQPQVVYQQRPQPPVVVNVVQPDPRYYEPATQYGRAPSWRNRQEAYEEYGYDPYPPPGYQVPPRPVYVQPQPVYVPPPVVIAQGYVPRNYPVYPAYGGGYINYNSRRGWSVGYRGY
ncbi:hypothetical protein [Burkholderia phage FLC9]|nr:hypothetical protein [Burkholderia phage FLC9]